jgi:hypothetical protein
MTTLFPIVEELPLDESFLSILREIYIRLNITGGTHIIKTCQIHVSNDVFLNQKLNITFMSNVYKFKTVSDMRKQLVIDYNIFINNVLNSGNINASLIFIKQYIEEQFDLGADIILKDKFDTLQMENNISLEKTDLFWERITNVNEYEKLYTEIDFCNVDPKMYTELQNLTTLYINLEKLVCLMNEFQRYRTVFFNIKVYCKDDDDERIDEWWRYFNFQRRVVIGEVYWKKNSMKCKLGKGFNIYGKYKFY